jgi:hypothetical protein
VEGVDDDKRKMTVVMSKEEWVKTQFGWVHRQDPKVQKGRVQNDKKGPEGRSSEASAQTRCPWERKIRPPNCGDYGVRAL